jgi:hypothetical protein
MGWRKCLQTVAEEWKQANTLPPGKAVWLEFVDKLFVFFFISTYYIISYLFPVVNPSVKQGELLFQECSTIALNIPYLALNCP